jgi:hypothetical protein
MSDDRTQLELRAEIARIDRDRAESEKLRSESIKLAADREKLFYEALKFEREHSWYVPLALLGNGALAAIIGALVARLIH